tara:strand:+ start:3934 stop:4380 length:447 start_codon:yes stop_codon:yes gene_type:complete
LGESIVIVVKYCVPLNAHEPILVTLDGIVIIVNPDILNAESPIVTRFNDELKMTLDRFVLPENAATPIVITESGIITAVSSVMFINALTAISTTGLHTPVPLPLLLTADGMDISPVRKVPVLVPVIFALPVILPVEITWYVYVTPFSV